MPVFFTTSVSWGKQQLSVYILNANFLANLAIFGANFGIFFGKFWQILGLQFANFRGDRILQHSTGQSIQEHQT